MAQPWGWDLGRPRVSVQGAGASSSLPAAIITPVPGQVGGATSAGGLLVDLDYVFPDPVTVGNIVTIAATAFAPFSEHFAAGDCVKAAGTANIGPVRLSGASNDGAEQSVAIWSARINSSGTLTMRITLAGSGAFLRMGCGEYESSTGWVSGAGRLEDYSGANGNSLAPASGPVSSAGAALFIAVQRSNTSGSTTLIEPPGYSLVFSTGTGDGVAERIAAGALASDPQWEIDGVAGPWVAAAAVLRPN